MIPAQLAVNIDKAAIRGYIEKRLDEEINDVLWLIDIKKLASLCCMSERYCEQMITSDVRMRAIERRKQRKRWWPYREAMQIVDEITKDW